MIRQGVAAVELLKPSAAYGPMCLTIERRPPLADRLSREADPLQRDVALARPAKSARPPFCDQRRSANPVDSNVASKRSDVGLTESSRSRRAQSWNPHDPERFADGDIATDFSSDRARASTLYQTAM